MDVPSFLFEVICWIFRASGVYGLTHLTCTYPVLSGWTVFLICFIHQASQWMQTSIALGSKEVCIDGWIDGAEA